MRSADHSLWWNPHLTDENHQVSVVASRFSGASASIAKPVNRVGQTL
jgi:hypothetical protein